MTSIAADAQPAEQNSRRLPKIALEEHFLLPGFTDYYAASKQNIRPEWFDRALRVLADFGERRLSEMDENGIETSVLSLAGPGVQVEHDTDTAVRMARVANDLLAAETHKQPARYKGFAHLPMQDPRRAADELERCMVDLGFKGALINGHTHGIYLDERRYDVFWERASALKAPIYIHPTNSPDRVQTFHDHPEMWGAVWAWTVETATHALRLVLSGLFDRYPDAAIVLGHMGETLPFLPWRFDSRYPNTNQVFKLEKKPSEYLRSNVLITTSGVCSDPSLHCSLDALGRDRVMFSVDYPFENTRIACDWIEQAALAEDEREAVAYGNAKRIFRI